MRKFVLIAALALASAGAQAGESRSLSTDVTTNDPPAAINKPPKPVPLRAETEGAAMPPPASQPPAVETPRYAPPAPETPKPVDTTRNTETPTQTQAPNSAARPAPVDTTPTAVTPPSTRQDMPPRAARYHHGHIHHTGTYGSGYRSDYGWGIRRPSFRSRHWSTWRIIAALHRYGFYW